MSGDRLQKLRCNRCWNLLNGDYAFVTSCSHIFCEEDANQWFSRHPECPCCQQVINKDADVRKAQLVPDANLRMFLWGLNPSVVFEICSTAIGFYLYQKKQELAWHQHLIKQKEKKALSSEKDLKTHIIELENHINVLTNDIKTQHDEFKLRDQAYNQMKNDLQEKTRQCSKYESLYNQLMLSRQQHGESAGMTPQSKISPPLHSSDDSPRIGRRSRSSTPQPMIRRNSAESPYEVQGHGAPLAVLSSRLHRIRESPTLRDVRIQESPPVRSRQLAAQGDANAWNNRHIILASLTAAISGPPFGRSRNVQPSLGTPPSEAFGVHRSTQRQSNSHYGFNVMNENTRLSAENPRTPKRVSSNYPKFNKGSGRIASSTPLAAIFGSSHSLYGKSKKYQSRR